MKLPDGWKEFEGVRLWRDGKLAARLDCGFNFEKDGTILLPLRSYSYDDLCIIVTWMEKCKNAA